MSKFLLKCFECRQDNSGYYCTCNQIYLCQRCLEEHHTSHYALNKTLDLFSPVFPLPDDSESLNPFCNYIDELISDVHRKVQEDIEFLQNFPLPYTENDIKVKYTQIFSQENFDACFSMKRPDSVFTLVPEETSGSTIIEITLQSLQQTKLIIPFQAKLSTAWVLQKENCLYILGGLIGFLPNEKIFCIDLKNYTCKIIGETPTQLTAFACIVNGNFIYVIGGRKIIGSEKVLKSDVLVYDIENEFFLENFNTRSGRFPHLHRRRSNCAAVIHKKKMYVVSNSEPSKPDTIEILDFDNIDRGFVEKEFKMKVALSSGLISVGSFIYMMNESNILNFDEDLRIQILASFEKPYDSYNITISPTQNDDYLYFFGLKHLIKFGLTNNSCQVIKLDL